PWGEVSLPNIAGIQITRFMVMELVAAGLTAAIMIPLARRAAREHVTRGWFFNLFETLLTFIPGRVARPTIGHHADQYVPFLWTVFFFVLFNNLMGLIPGGASPTGNINVTVVMALMTFATVLFAGIRELGFVGFWVGVVPHLDVPMLLKPILW